MKATIELDFNLDDKVFFLDDQTNIKKGKIIKIELEPYMTTYTILYCSLDNRQCLFERSAQTIGDSIEDLKARLFNPQNYHKTI